MEGGVARWIWQQGLVLGVVLGIIALSGYYIVANEFDFIAIAFGAFVVLQLGISLTPWPRIRQEALFIGPLLLTIAIFGEVIMKIGFDVPTIAFGAFLVLHQGTCWAMQARHTVAITIGLVLSVEALAVCSYLLLAHSEGDPVPPSARLPSCGLGPLGVSCLRGGTVIVGIPCRYCPDMAFCDSNVVTGFYDTGAPRRGDDNGRLSLLAT